VQTASLNEDECFINRPGHFTPRKGAPIVIEQGAGYLWSRSECFARREIFRPYRDSNHRTLEP